MRFTVSRALDAIEGRLTTDPVLASAVVDVASVVRHAGLDDGRPAHLLRLGMVIDALARRNGDDSVMVYPVAERGLLSDLELTSNEKMVIRRWGDDGLAEVVPELGDRVLEIAELARLPMISRADYAPYHDRFGGIVARRLTPVPGAGGAVLSGDGAAGAASPPGGQNPVLRRWWRCAEPMCPSFGGGEQGAQPPPRLVRGEPVCPRHRQPLADVGVAPPAVAVLALVEGAARRRFTVRADRPTAVGRNPEAPGIRLGELLDDEAVRLVSRSHVLLGLSDGSLMVEDTSTNGSVVLTRTGPDAAPAPVELQRGQRRVLSAWDRVELHTGVELADARHWRPSGPADSSSTLAEAPTMAFRIPPQAQA